MDWTLSTVVPLVGLAGLGWLVPVLLARACADSLRGVAVALILAVAVLTLAGAGLFAWLYWAGGAGGAVAGAPGHFFRLGLRGALVWGPILGLTGIGLAQGVERRRGRRLAARDRGGCPNLDRGSSD